MHLMFSIYFIFQLILNHIASHITFCILSFQTVSPLIPSPTLSFPISPLLGLRVLLRQQSEQRADPAGEGQGRRQMVHAPRLTWRPMVEWSVSQVT